MADYESFQFGSTVFPLEVNATPIDQIGDPAIYTVLEYLKAMIIKNLGDRWDAEFAGSADLVGNIISEDANYDPTPYFRQGQYTLPLLALYRTNTEVIEKTVAYYAHRSTWQLLYIFEPVDVSQVRRVQSFLHLIATVIVDRIEQGYDPSYQNGELIFSTAGISKIKITDFNTHEQAENIVEGNLDYKILMMNFEVEEQEECNPDLSNFEGVDGYVSVSDSDTEVELIEFTKDL